MAYKTKRITGLKDFMSGKVPPLLPEQTRRSYLPQEGLPAIPYTKEEREYIAGSARGAGISTGVSDSSTDNWDPLVDFKETQAHPEDWTWTPQEKQSIALSSKAFEIYYGGSRFGGKTACQIIWLMILGIERLHGRIRYPTYKGLILRRQYEDLKGWMKAATPIYKRMGATATGRPLEYKFPGGPFIATGHLDSLTGFEKYQGQEWHKCGIDEVNQIPELDMYLPLQGSIRMSPDGLSQLFLTGNPGGPGDIWIKDRFIYVYSNGKMVPWGTLFRDPESGKTRVFIQAFPKDNAVGLANDSEYLGVLKGMNPITRRQWLDGDWDAVQSSFFTDFRSRRFEGEPDNFLHCVPSSSVELLPHYRRWISMDWGYNDLCVVYWHCQHEDGRIYTYREFVCRKTAAHDVGKMIAQLSYDELSRIPDNSMELFLSPDAFSTKDTANNISQQVGKGVESVLGFGTCTLLSMTDEEKVVGETNTQLAQKMFLDRIINTLSQSGITIRPANNRRADGWSYMQTLLQCHAVSQVPSIQELMSQLNKLGQGSPEAIALVKRYHDQLKSDSVLPKWRIFEDKCPLLIKTLPLCQRDPSKPDDIIAFNGDDPVDAARYGLMGYQSMPAEMPKDYVILQMIEAYKSRCKSSGVHVDVNVMKMMWEQKKFRERLKMQVEGGESESLFDQNAVVRGAISFSSPFQSEEEG